jgi:hypothetical protein
MPVVHARLIMLQSCVMWGQCCMAVSDTESLSVMLFVTRVTCITGVRQPHAVIVGGITPTTL